MAGANGRGNGCEPCPTLDPAQAARLREQLAVHFGEAEKHLVTSDISPHLESPIDGRHLTIGPVRVVVNIPEATDAIAYAAGQNMADAEGEFDEIEALAPTVVAQPVIVHEHKASRGSVHVLKWWALDVLIGDPSAASVTVEVGGPSHQSDPPSPLMGGLQHAGLVIPDGKSLVVKVANLDTRAPILVAFSAIGWSFNRKWVDGDPRSLLRTKDYGRCK